LLISSKQKISSPYLNFKAWRWYNLARDVQNDVQKLKTR